jgi:hypothetical protein
MNGGCDWIRNADAPSLTRERPPWLDALTLPDGIAGSSPVFYGTITCFEKNCHGNGTALAQCEYVPSCVEGGISESDSPKHVANPIIEFVNGHIVTRDVVAGAFTISLSLEFVSTAATVITSTTTSTSPRITPIPTVSLSVQTQIQDGKPLMTAEPLTTSATEDDLSLSHLASLMNDVSATPNDASMYSDNEIGVIAGAAAGGLVLVCCALAIAIFAMRSHKKKHLLPIADAGVTDWTQFGNSRVNVRGGTHMNSIEPMESARAMPDTQAGLAASSGAKYVGAVNPGAGRVGYGAFDMQEI